MEYDAAFRKKFARLMTEGRLSSGMSLREAADEFRTAPGTVSRWEKGYSVPAAWDEILSFYWKKRTLRQENLAGEAMRRITLTHDELHKLVQLLLDYGALEFHLRGSGLSALGKKEILTTLKELGTRLLHKLHKRNEASI